MLVTLPRLYARQDRPGRRWWTVDGDRWAMGGGQWNWEVGGKNCGDGHGTVLRSPRPVSYTAVTPVVPVWMGGKTGGFRGGYF